MSIRNIEILLATYNGEKYLPDLLNSLFQQTIKDFRISIRDDGSTDKTIEIIKSFQKQFPETISIFQDNHRQLGAISNFSILLQNSSAKYVMLCDQDDVWLPNKIADSLAGIQKLEKEFGDDTPALLHTDLIVVNENLNELAPSFFQYSKLDSKRNKFNQFLVQNIITGCSIIMNRALVELSWPIPEEARMHDWWIALTASSMGIIGFLPNATVSYRQHPKNTVGANKYNTAYIYRKIKEILRNRGRNILEENFRQAEIFLEIYASALPEDKLYVLNQFLKIKNQNFFQKRFNLIKHGFLKGTLIQNIGLLLTV